MVTSGHDRLTRLSFQPHGGQLGVEVLSWSEVVARGGPPSWPHRTEFHTLLLLDKGRLPLHLDFVEADRGPRSLLWARPGQVQQFGRPRAVDGRALFFVAEYPAPSEAVDSLLGGPCPPWSWTLDPAQHARASQAFHEIQESTERANDAIQAQFAQHTLTTLLLWLGTCANPPEQAANRQSLILRIHREIERSYATSRRVDEYAHRLGYSAKTLTRAAQAATGLTLKQLIDDRVVLEAKRSLAHTDAPLEVIAHELGFTEATNFAKFFTRQAGETAGAFRRRVRCA